MGRMITPLEGTGNKRSMTPENEPRILREQREDRLLFDNLVADAFRWRSRCAEPARLTRTSSIVLLQACAEW